MPTYTFRTESSCDNDAALALIQAANGKLVSSELVSDPALESWKMGIFTFESKRSLDSLRKFLFRLIAINPKYADLHRCAQTLAKGLKPDNQWFLK